MKCSWNQIGDLELKFSCWKNIEMDSLLSLKTAMNMLGNPGLGHLENFQVLRQLSEFETPYFQRP